MSLPTMTDNPANVYATLPGGSVTGNALGLTVGMRFQSSDDMKVYMFVQADASSLPINGACYLSTVTGAYPLTTAFKVTPTSTANTQPIIGINDNSGVIVTTGQYCWLTIYGRCTPLVAAAVATNTFVVSSATSGQLQAATAGTSIQANILTTTASGAGGATNCWMF